MVSSGTNRLRKKITIALPFVLIFLEAIYILLRMAQRANRDFNFNYWSLDMQFVGLAVVCSAAWGIYIIIIR